MERVTYVPAENTEYFSYLENNGSQFSYRFFTGGKIVVKNPDRPEQAEIKVKAGTRHLIGHDKIWTFEPAPSNTEGAEIPGFNPDNAAHQANVRKQMKIENSPLTTPRPADTFTEQKQDQTKETVENPATGKAKSESPKTTTPKK